MGQIVHAYHGSSNKFDEFSFDFVGTASGTSGAGFGIYFTEVESEAFVYGENCYHCILVLKSPLDNYKITLSKFDIFKLLSKLYDVEFNFYENYGMQKVPVNSDSPIFNKIYDSLINSCTCDTEIIGSIVNSGCDVKLIMEVLVEMGYTHTIDNVEPDDLISTHWIVYDLNAISIKEVYTLDTRNI